MRRRQLVRCALGLGGGVALGGLAASSPRLRWERRALLGFGTTLSIQAAHADADALRLALDAAVAAIRRIEAEMSLFDPASALSRLNRDGTLDRPPAELLAVLRVARSVSERSDGAFDATVQPLWLAFESARREGRLPGAAEVAAARAAVDWRAVEVDDRRIRLLRPGMAVTLNGIAQGHAGDRVREVLAARGVRHALIDSGEFTPVGRNAEGRHWTLGIADPRHEAALLARLVTDGRCIATSGDDQAAFSADRRHHHIFDPRTGRSPPELAGVTVAAGSGALADALTKVMFVAGPSRAFALAREWGVDVLLVDKAGRWRATPGLLAAPV